MGSSRIHGLCEQHLVFVVHGHNDEELGLSSQEVGPKRVARLEKVVGITSCGCIAHLGHFLNILTSSRNDVGRHGHIEH